MRTLQLFGAALLMALGAVRAQPAYREAFPGLGFARPVWVGEMPGHPGRFVVMEQQNGKVILVTKSDTTWSKSDILTLPVYQDNEMGLLGFAFHPDFIHNRRYYVSYNPPSPLSSVIEARRMDSTFRFDSGLKPRVILTVGQPATNHNGGNLAFGPKDGFLYIGFGDGGNQHDPDRYGQNKDTLLAKILRIDVDDTVGGRAYGIPKDNPFANGGGDPEIFAYGFRNPWRWSFDALNGNLWVGDVGQDMIEEEDLVAKGGNYGWSDWEATRCENGNPCVEAGFTFPVFSYTHSHGNAIIGGYVFRGDAASPFYGKLIVADNGSDSLWVLAPNGQQAASAQAFAGPPGANPSSFGVDLQGGLYLVDLGGTIFKLADGTAGALPHKGPLREFTGRTMAAAPGDRLDARLLGAADRAQLWSLRGARAGEVTRALPRLPADLRPGIYLLRVPGISKPDLIVVR